MATKKDPWYDGPYRIGEWVWLFWGGEKTVGNVVKDLGPLGEGGKHIYELEISEDPDEPRVVALREDRLEPIPPGVDPEPMPEKSKVVEYLKHGGLISILHANHWHRVNDQPRAWLRPGGLGLVTHTLAASRGKVGGAPIPFQAVEDFKIKPDRRDEVAKYLTTFGLDPADIEEILAEVGVAKKRRSPAKRG